MRAAANVANGMALDLGGWLVVCEQGSRVEHARISPLDPGTGAVETVVDRWGGLRFDDYAEVWVNGRLPLALGQRAAR